MIHLVLYQPEIPQNTGNIARLCACNGLVLHLIHPLGFSLASRRLHRAGLDYWHFLELVEHPCWEAFWDELEPEVCKKAFFFSSKVEKNYWEAEFPQECWLIFGSETRGLPQNLRGKFFKQFLTIPMVGEHYRCLNLSSSVSIAAYEVLRQHTLKGHMPRPSLRKGA